MPLKFPVTPPSPHAAWLLGALLAIPLIIIAATQGLMPAADGAAVKRGLAFGVVIVGAVAASTFWGLGRREVQLEGRRLLVKAAMFSRALDVDELDMARARIVDLDERIELRPILKTFGMALPGFHAGWFLLRDRSRAFCLLTARRRVLWLPTRTGKALMLSLERPEALLEALRQMTTSPAGRRA